MAAPAHVGSKASLPTEKPKRPYGKTKLYIRGMKRDRLVMELVEKIQETMPEISDDRFYATIYAWCQFEVLAGRVYAELKDGIVNAEGDSRRLLDDFRKLRSTQILFSRELGLTPASLASIRSLLSQTSEKPEADIQAIRQALHAEAEEP